MGNSLDRKRNLLSESGNPINLVNNEISDNFLAGRDIGEKESFHKKYYEKFVAMNDPSFSEYVETLTLDERVELFDDYYNGEYNDLFRIIGRIPHQVRIDEYFLSLLDIQESNSIKAPIAKANNTLLSKYFNESKWNLISELFNAVRSLELNISENILLDIISNESIEDEVREHAAITLSVVHENQLNSFWDTLDLKKDMFLIPSYIGFFEKTNPIKALSALLLIEERPNDIEAFETSILNSLLQVGNSLSDIEKYKKLSMQFPIWATDFIEEVFEDYSELKPLKEKLNIQ